MRTYDQYDSPGAWSGYLSFTVDTDPPNVPNLYTPADGAFTNDTTPRLVCLRGDRREVLQLQGGKWQ